jgi:glycine cleavage system H protein
MDASSRFELLSPLSGEVVAVNEALFNPPELVNRDPYDEGWLVLIRPREASNWREQLL